MKEIEKDHDKGLQALLATGLVPEGFIFKTNVASYPNRFNTPTKESIVQKYESQGFQVIVLEGMGFDKDGQKTGADAILVRKIEAAS